MKKVMILANSDVGLYKFRRELLEILLQKYEVHISLPYGSFVDEMIRMGCVFHETALERRGTNPGKDLALLHRYRTLLRQERPDVVLTYTIKPNVYGGIASAAQNIPYIANITGLGSAVENKGSMQFVTTSLYKVALRKAAKVFFQNEENRRFMMERGLVKGESDLLPGSGVNLFQYQPMPYPDGDTVNFIFVARVMKEKGIDQYLDAARYITAKYPNACFHICGSCDEDYADILKCESELGHIVYHGSVGDMLPIYEMCACTVHPTYYPEGMSNVLLESCASGRPIITTDRPGCREIVEDGVNGYICRQQDSQDLIAQIERFLARSWEERMEMGLRARQKAAREFDRSIVIRKYMTELEKIWMNIRSY